MRIYILLLLALVSVGMSAQSRRAKKKPKVEAAPIDPQKEKEATLFAEMLPNTQKLCIVDSVVVGVDELIKAIPLPKEYGKVMAYDEFFGTKTGRRGYVSINGNGNKCLYAEMAADSTYSLYSRTRLGNSWSEPTKVKGLGGNFKQMALPIMCFDGTTMYFSASSKDGLGGYDIYMTTLDSSEGEFMQAENMGLPYNSDADDLLYMEDEIDGIAWLATTRRQPEGMVCIYTIALSATRQNYDGENIEDSRLKNLAAISSIKDTWESAEQLKSALENIAAMKQKMLNNEDEADIHFVVNDDFVCHKMSDFSSAESQKLYQTIAAKRQQLMELQANLLTQRTKYRSATISQRQNMRMKILEMEKQTELLQREISAKENELRAKEASQK